MLRNSDLAGLFYAKGRLLGSTVPYFGAIPIVANERVESWIQYFKTSGRREFMRWLVRGESVKETVQPLLQENGVPMEFFYLAMVESGFSNSAYSRARATGTSPVQPFASSRLPVRSPLMACQCSPRSVERNSTCAPAYSAYGAFAENAIGVNQV